LSIESPRHCCVLSCDTARCAGHWSSCIQPWRGVPAAGGAAVAALAGAGGRAVGGRQRTGAPARARAGGGTVLIIIGSLVGGRWIGTRVCRIWDILVSMYIAGGGREGGRFVICEQNRGSVKEPLYRLYNGLYSGSISGSMLYNGSLTAPGWKLCHVWLCWPPQRHSARSKQQHGLMPVSR
jgi:hypothetical protein